MTKRTVPPIKLKLPTEEADVLSTTRMVPVDQVTVLPGFNLRVDEDIDDLAAKIEANGFYLDKPLAGYQADDGTIIVTDGHRRLAAVKRLNDNSLDGPVIDALPVVLRSGDPTDLTVAMIATSEGLPLTMFEKGIGVRRLMDGGMTKPEVARRLGCSEKTIENYLLVAGVPAKARDLLLDGKVTSTQVLRLKGDPDKLKAMVATAEGKGRTRARPSDAVPVRSIKTVEKFDPDAPNGVRIEAVPPESEYIQKTTLTDGAADVVTVTVVKDGDMRTVLQRVAAEIRKRVPHSEGDDDLAFVNGSITVTVTLAQQPAPAKRKSAKKAPAELPLDEPDPLAHAIPADDEL